MNNVIDVLEERGFIDSKTHDHELRDYINSGPATCYIGFDPTAASLHIGSLVPIMALAHMQRNGHRPIALVGGGTGLRGGLSRGRSAQSGSAVDQVSSVPSARRARICRARPVVIRRVMAVVRGHRDVWRSPAWVPDLACCSICPHELTHT